MLWIVRHCLCLGILLALLGPAQSQAPAQKTVQRQLISGISHEQINVTLRFSGEKITVFGTVKWDLLPSQNIVITVRGGDQKVRIHQRVRQYGLLMKTGTREYSHLPVFYGLLSLYELAPSMREFLDLQGQYRPSGNQDIDPYLDAWIEHNYKMQHYQQVAGTINLLDKRLFVGQVSLPSTTSIGQYEVNVFLTENGEIIEQARHYFTMRKTGLEYWLSVLAESWPVTNGILYLLLSLGAGLFGAIVFRRL